VTEPGLTIGVCTRGTGFGSPDGIPTRLFFLLSAPSLTDYFRLAAMVAFLIRLDGLVDAIIAAGTKDEVMSLLMNAQEEFSYRVSESFLQGSKDESRSNVSGRSCLTFTKDMGAIATWI
jgi:hypothetical protein